MYRIVARPNQLDLDSPGRRDYWLALEHDSIWGDHLIPLTVWVGPNAKPNEGLVSFGSNHGNEYEGPVVLKNLLSEIKTEDVLGRIIFIPVLNPSAFPSRLYASANDSHVRPVAFSACKIPQKTAGSVAPNSSYCTSTTGPPCVGSSKNM